jgi:hypothetical protein
MSCEIILEHDLDFDPDFDPDLDSDPDPDPDLHPKKIIARSKLTDQRSNHSCLAK